MSGFFGIFSKDCMDIPPGVARTALQILNPSGDEQVSFRQTRSSLLCASALSRPHASNSSQIAVNESGRIHAVCEGNILNSSEISHRLKRMGHTVASDGGAGILTHLGEARQADWELGLRGSFACAVWDDYERTLRLSVDRFGGTSLYWMGGEDWIVFASTLPVIRKTLLEWGREAAGTALPRSFQGWLHESGWRLDLQVLGGYLASGCVGTPSSICQSICSLPPAGRLTWRMGTHPSVEIWWTPRFEHKRILSLKKGIPEFLEVFRETLPWYLDLETSNRLVLSADTASLFLGHEIARLAGAKCSVYVSSCEENTARENRLLREIAATLPMQPEYVSVPAPSGKDLPDVVRAMSEPCGNPSLWKIYNVLHRDTDREAPWLMNPGSAECWEVSPREVSTSPQGFWDGLFNPDVMMNPIPVPFLEPEKPNDPEQLQDLDVGYILPYFHLRPLRDLSAAAAWKIHTPWLDPVLFEWVGHLPRSLKFSGHISHWLLRKLLANGSYPIPQSLLVQQSASSSPPVDRWLSRHLAALFQDTVLSSHAALGPVFLTPRLRQTFEAHRAGCVRLGHPLWNLLILELWLRENRLEV